MRNRGLLPGTAHDSLQKRVSVLECSSPLELSGGRSTLESAGGPAQSRTLARDHAVTFFTKQAFRPIEMPSILQEIS